MRVSNILSLGLLWIGSVSALFAGGGAALSGDMSSGQDRIVVIKADDLRVPNEKWKRFTQIIEAKGVKASIGLIAYGFPRKDEAAVRWANEQQASERIEFWNHGWDHNIWKDAEGRKVTEFYRSGYTHQKNNLEKSQKKFASILGHAARVFGPPFNGMDTDTIAVLEAMPELEGIFYYHKKEPFKTTSMDGKAMLYMNLPGENDGVGKPNFEKFKKKYESKQAGLTFTALQFHPPYFSEERFAEFEKIIDFLKEEGWVFMLPGEYIDSFAR